MHLMPSPRNKLSKIFTFLLVLYINFLVLYTERTVRLKTTSLTDDVIDWPDPHKILGCATVGERPLALHHQQPEKNTQNVGAASLEKFLPTLMTLTALD